MGWSHPNISLEDLLQLIKGFVDILVLASGYQSCGSEASWDAESIKRAVKWGLFFEEVLRRLRESKDTKNSIMELDAALFDMKSLYCFPEGLKNLSSATLSSARDFVLESLFENLPLREAHLKSLLTAIIEMNLEELAGSKDEIIDLFIEKLKFESSYLLHKTRRFMKKPTISSLIGEAFTPEVPCGEKSHQAQVFTSNHERRHDHSSNYIFEKLVKRKAALSSLSIVECSMSATSNVTVKGIFSTFKNGCSDMPYGNGLMTSADRETFDRLLLLDQWRSRSLSYLLDKRTIRLLSGANLIFRGTKEQSVHMVERLINSKDIYHDNPTETIELLLLGIVSENWKRLIEHYMSISCECTPISEQLYSLQHVLHKSQAQVPQMKMLNHEETDVLEYLASLLGSQAQFLERISPVLVAAAIPSCSILFKLYLTGVQRQLQGEYPAMRFCTVFTGAALATWMEWITARAKLLREFGACTHFMFRDFISRLITKVHETTELHFFLCPH